MVFFLTHPPYFSFVLSPLYFHLCSYRSYYSAKKTRRTEAITQARTLLLLTYPEVVSDPLGQASVQPAMNFVLFCLILKSRYGRMCERVKTYTGCDFGSALWINYPPFFCFLHSFWLLYYRQESW